MANKLLPNFQDYIKWATQGAFQPVGEEGAIKLGDIETAGWNATPTRIERYSREFAEKTLAASRVIQKDGNFNMVLMSINRLVRATLFMGAQDSYLEQEAVTDATKTFNNLVVGRVYSLGAKNVSINSFDDGEEIDPIAFVQDTHYRLIAETGDWELVAIPAGAAKAVVGFDAPEIGEADDIESYGLMEGAGIMGKLLLWGTDDSGTDFHIEVWSAELTPNGEVALQGGDDFMQMPVNVRVFADGTKPTRFRYGRVTIFQN